MWHTSNNNISPCSTANIHGNLQRRWPNGSIFSFDSSTHLLVFNLNLYMPMHSLLPKKIKKSHWPILNCLLPFNFYYKRYFCHFMVKWEYYNPNGKLVSYITQIRRLRDTTKKLDENCGGKYNSLLLKLEIILKVEKLSS
jgi:hypothetical protein